MKLYFRVVLVKGVKDGEREFIEKNQFSQSRLVDNTLHRNNLCLCTWPYSLEVICSNTL
jgi:hypothetical protein